ncbi:MAG: ABC transporter ATP-binding protein/permease [Oscillospiraceae bacterium]|nr:ABC transporter ATP-binding protein/permease [Oscillospiraceae bacterium]
MLKLLRRMTKQEWGLAVLAFALVLVQVWFNLTMPDYMSEITTLVETEGSAMSDVLSAGGMMLLCALGALASAAMVAVLASRIASSFSAEIRSKLFRQVQAFSPAEIGKFSTASLITRSTNDVTQVQMVIVLGLEVLLRAPVTAIWAVCKIWSKNWAWTTATGVAVVLLLAIVGTCVMVAMPRFRRLQVLTDNINRVTRENLTGLPVVRAYNAEKYQEKKFSAANEELTHTNLVANRTMAVIFPSIQFIMSGLTLAVYWIGAYLINNAGATDRLGLFSDMVVFSQYAMQIVMAFMMLVMIFVLLPRASVAAQRINQVLETKPTILDGSAAQGQQGQRGEVEFRHVTFCYPDSGEPVLRDITFTAHQGETVALIGATGSGKSTVINLIPRFYDVTEGQVLVDGVDVREYTQAALRNKIGYVSQKATLFSGTVRSNVAYGDNGRETFLDSDVVNAVYTAQAAEFVEKLPEGYDGRIAQGGGNLSGGQKQRLSIARAICRRAEILIFDDSFSALDYRTDKTLRQALNDQCGDATRLIVAQRIGTIRDADRILVLDEGQIVGQGTHQELMENCQVYQEIALSQLSKEELA